MRLRMLYYRLHKLHFTFHCFFFFSINAYLYNHVNTDNATLQNIEHILSSLYQKISILQNLITKISIDNSVQSAYLKQTFHKYSE